MGLRRGRLGIGFGFAGGVPDWWLSGADHDLDFAGNRIYGAAAFTDLLSISRNSTAYAETVAGTLTSFGTHTLRRTDKGLLIEETRTNVVLHNSDLTNAAWTKSNTNAAKDQTGPDEVANSASSLTATAANGTALQAITLGSSARFQTAYIKRITGSGTVDMTMDNGTTWTAVTVTAGWTRVSIPTQTLANPTVGFRIVTSGDAVAIGFVQNENNASFATSPIATTTASVTRAADNVSIIGSVLTTWSGTDATAVISHGGGLVGAAGRRLLDGDGTGDARHLLVVNDVTVRSTLNSVDLNTNPLTNALANPLKAGLAWSATGRSLTAQGLTVVTDANKPATTTAMWLGSESGTGGFLGGYITRATAWNSRLADATLQSLTA